MDQVLRPARRLLLDTAKTRCPRERYRTRVRRELARDHFEQRRFSGAVAADEARACVAGKGGGRLVEKNPRPEPQSDVVDMEHAGLSPAWLALTRARHRQLRASYVRRLETVGMRGKMVRLHEKGDPLGRPGWRLENWRVGFSGRP